MLLCLDFIFVPLTKFEGFLTLKRDLEIPFRGKNADTMLKLVNSLLSVITFY